MKAALQTGEYGSRYILYKIDMVGKACGFASLVPSCKKKKKDFVSINVSWLVVLHMNKELMCNQGMLVWTKCLLFIGC